MLCQVFLFLCFAWGLAFCYLVHLARHSPEIEIRELDMDFDKSGGDTTPSSSAERAHCSNLRLPISQAMQANAECLIVFRVDDGDRRERIKKFRWKGRHKIELQDGRVIPLVRIRSFHAV